NNQNINSMINENTINTSVSEEIKSEEDIRLEQDNIQLVREMTTQFKEIKDIQNKLHQIYKLQTFFSEEVMRQKEDIEIIADVTDDSVLNVEEGNKQIKKAIEKQFTSDSVLLFVIIILTLAVIYLDWFQD
ncbi:hypothetical protein, partial [Salmonella sp. s51228]|uniref:hypothetical protein n=1 Tax=Salmonella sp. s51228 TaxID=3159652 RepID=UPI003980B788